MAAVKPGPVFQIVLNMPGAGPAAAMVPAAAMPVSASPAVEEEFNPVSIQEMEERAKQIMVKRNKSAWCARLA
jgi:hypothetical protein